MKVEKMIINSTLLVWLKMKNMINGKANLWNIIWAVSTIQFITPKCYQFKQIIGNHQKLAVCKIDTGFWKWC